MEEKRRLRVRLEVAALPRGVVRVEDEPPFVVALQEHHPDGRRTAGIRRRERHRLRHLERGGRLSEPGSELVERIAGEVGSPELGLPLHAQSFARSSAGRKILAPSSPSLGTSSCTTRSTTSASSLSGLRILFPLSRALPRGPVCTARSRSA